MKTDSSSLALPQFLNQHRFHYLCWMCQREYISVEVEHQKPLLCVHCSVLEHQIHKRYDVKYVYFMARSDSSLIKIGATKNNPLRRKYGISGAYLFHSIPVR